ncbi:hypothetical protein [Niastella vici]|nr:hypothetical protein [Niastella vici]
MKKSSATVFSPTMELPAITKKLTRRIVRRKTNRKAEPILNTVSPPSEETIRQLNRIAQEYPFCVYYKQKVNDPL